MLDKNISYFYFSIYTFYSTQNADLLGIKETYRRFYMTCPRFLLDDKPKKLVLISYYAISVPILARRV